MHRKPEIYWKTCIIDNGKWPKCIEIASSVFDLFTKERVCYLFLAAGGRRRSAGMGHRIMGGCVVILVMVLALTSPQDCVAGRSQTQARALACRPHICQYLSNVCASYRS